MKRFCHVIIKTAVFLIAVLYSFLGVYAQEYNNWLLTHGLGVDFNTSPVSFYNIEEYLHVTVSISDENGKLLIYGGYKGTSTFELKNYEHKTILSIPVQYIRTAIACKTWGANNSYYVAVVCGNYGNYNKSFLRIYKFNDKAELIESFVSDYTGFSELLYFVPYYDGQIMLVAYNETKKNVEFYCLSDKGIKKQNNHALDLALNRYPMLFILNNIRHSFDANTILFSLVYLNFIIRYDISTNTVSVLNTFETKSMLVSAFSPNAKYLYFLLDKTKLCRCKLTSDFVFDIAKKEVCYEFSNSYSDMQLGNDGNIYILGSGKDIVCLSNSESENFSPENLTYTSYPHTASAKYFNHYLYKYEAFNFCSIDCSLIVDFFYYGRQPKKLSWDFGDGTFSNDKNPKHTYQKDGTYKVKLDIVFSDEETKSLEKEITIRNIIRQPILNEKD